MVLIRLSYKAYTSQLIRYSKACASYQEFLDNRLLLTRKLLNHQFLIVKLRSSLERYHWIITCHFLVVDCSVHPLTIGIRWCLLTCRSIGLKENISQSSQRIIQNQQMYIFQSYLQTYLLIVVYCSQWLSSTHVFQSFTNKIFNGLDDIYIYMRIMVGIM